MNWHRILLLMIVPAILPPRETASQDNLSYRFHYLHQDLLNPAVTGSEYIPKACLTYQKQWVGIPQSPQSMLATASIRIGNYDFYDPKKFINTTPLRSRERIGLGISLFSDRNGPATTRGAILAYAYHLPLEHARFSLGISASAGQRILDESNFRPTTPGDPLLTGIRESFTLFNASVGAYYYSPGLFGGLAFHNLIPLEDKSHPGEKVRPDLVLHGGYLFSSFGKPALEISMNLRYLDLENLEYDMHFRTYIKQVHWVALSFSSCYTLALHLGMKIRGFYLAYSYEANLSSMIRYQLGTHAIHLGINLGMRRTSW
jgi:type IX secretion system PorP/SprF family membrane protein